MKDIIGKLLLYNQWCNETMCLWLRSLDKSVLNADVASSFPSIRRTLQHMCNAQKFWYAIVSETVHGGDDEFSNVDDALRELQNGSGQMAAIFSMLDDLGLNKIVHSPEVIAAKYDFLIHVINHNTYHRGQIVSMVRFLGVVENIPNTDYEAYLWTVGNQK